MEKKEDTEKFNKLLEVISGEKKLREKEEAIKKAKKEAVEEAKKKKRQGIVKGKIKLEESDIPTKKVVQNVKVFEWSAPDRYQLRFENKAFLVVLALSLFFSLLLAILGNYLLMAAILSLLFLLYVAGTTKPITLNHKVTARGLDTNNKLYEWYLLDNFFFAKKNDGYYLIVETKLNFPRVLIFLLNEKEKDPLFVLLQEKVLYKDIRKWSRLDSLTYGEYIPLEKV